jgi:hypothetical protein
MAVVGGPFSIDTDVRRTVAALHVVDRLATNRRGAGLLIKFGGVASNRSAGEVR